MLRLTTSNKATGDTVTAEKLATIIREHISSEKDRYILYRHLIDGATYDQIADEMSDDLERVPTGNSIGKRYRRAVEKLWPYMA